MPTGKRSGTRPFRAHFKKRTTVRTRLTDDIRERARAVTDIDGLLVVLNDIKRLNQSPRAKSFHPITLQKLNFWGRIDQTEFFFTIAGTKQRGERYHHFKIPKRQGGFRTISAPTTTLKRLLRTINAFLACIYRPTDQAMGFVERRSVIDNAAHHTSKNYIFTTDISNFFPSITRTMVSRRLQQPPYSLSPRLAFLLSDLCCMKTYDDSGAAQYLLPQGAPTSPTITNIVCDRLDTRLASLARAYGMDYTRYADDITFSSNHNLFGTGSPVLRKIEQIIADFGFRQNEGKTRLRRRGERQEVTGLVVSDKVNIERRYLRELRATLHVWLRHGYSVAVRTFVFERHGDPRKMMEQTLAGRLQWVAAVKGADSNQYLRLCEKFDACIAALAAAPRARFRGNKTQFVETLAVADFERRHRCQLAMKRLPTRDGKGFRLKAFFRSQGVEISVDVSRNAYRLPLSSLAVSLCIHPRRGYFWLLHRPLPTSAATLSPSEGNNE